MCWHSSGVLVLTLTGWLVDVFGVPSPVSHVLNCILVTSPVTAPAPTQSCSLWRSVWCVYQYHSNNIPPTTASLYLPVECQIIMTTQITSYNQSSCPISWLLTDSQKSEYLNVSFYMEPKKRSGWCKSFFRKLFFHSIRINSPLQIMWKGGGKYANFAKSRICLKCVELLASY